MIAQEMLEKEVSRPLPGDELAICRTRLANERTLLAWLRSGVALMIAGATMIHFAREGWFLAVGIGCIPFGILCAATGVFRHAGTVRVIEGVRGEMIEALDESRRPHS